MKTLYKVNVINAVYVLANSLEEAEECAELAHKEEGRISLAKNAISEYEIHIASLDTVPDEIDKCYIPWTMEYFKKLPDIDGDDTIFQILNREKENNAGNSKIPS